jgi:deoxyhypusine synthase
VVYDGQRLWIVLRNLAQSVGRDTYSIDIPNDFAEIPDCTVSCEKSGFFLSGWSVAKQFHICRFHAPQWSG